MEATAEITAAVKNVPALRFPEFEGEWVKKKIKDISPVRSGSTPLRSNSLFFDGGTIPWVKTTDLNNSEIYETEECITDYALNNTSIRKNPVNSVLVAMYGGFNQIGRTGFLKVEACTNQALSVLNPYPDKVLPQYLLHWLNAKVDTWRSFAGSSRKDPNITGSDVAAFPILYPTIVEQQKIASFLTIVDDKIQQLSKKKELLEKYKKGVMQQIFSQQIRFKDDNGKDFPEWEEKRLGEVFERVKSKNAENNKNVLTISAQHGLINQEDFFNKSVSAENVTGYYLLHKGDFAYNKSYSKGYPMGAIKRLTKYDKGIVSTLYICFKIKDGSSEEYYEQYFSSGNLNSELHKIAQEGARNHGLLNMSVVEFFNDIKLPRPTIAEQIKIANFLTSIDNKLNYTSKQLEQAQQFKKGLLQQLFV